MEHIDQTGTIEAAPHLKPEHLPVFDCSFRPQNGTRFIHHMGHVRMMAAVQPFVSGAISKTINMPEEATVEDIMDAYIESWRIGLKAVAIYRDNCKRSQPLSTSPTTAKAKPVVEERTIEKIVYRPLRRKLPDERQSLTHKFSIAGHEGYITVGLFEDGTPGEIFITMSKEGSTISGLMDSFATSISFCLQYGVPLQFLVDKYSHVRFERLDRQQRDPLRQVADGLHLSVDRVKVPAPGLQNHRGRQHPAAEAHRSTAPTGSAF